MSGAEIGSLLICEPWHRAMFAPRSRHQTAKWAGGSPDGAMFPGPESDLRRKLGSRTVGSEVLAQTLALQIQQQGEEKANVCQLKVRTL